MKVNADLIIELRQKQCWSQDELAIAAGLNLRTIQRIEKEYTASLQSKKAIASALNVNFADLDYEETSMKKQYEYKTLEIENNEGFLAGFKKAKLPDLQTILNQEGQDGWLLVQILTPELAQNALVGKTGNLLAIFQREITH